MLNCSCSVKHSDSQSMAGLDWVESQTPHRERFCCDKKSHPVTKSNEQSLKNKSSHLLYKMTNREIRIYGNKLGYKDIILPFKTDIENAQAREYIQV